MPAINDGSSIFTEVPICRASSKIETPAHVPDARTGVLLQDVVATWVVAGDAATADWTGDGALLHASGPAASGG
jgi:hypothetical protein